MKTVILLALSLVACGGSHAWPVEGDTTIVIVTPQTAAVESDAATPPLAAPDAATAEPFAVDSGVAETVDAGAVEDAAPDAYQEPLTICHGPPISVESEHKAATMFCLHHGGVVTFTLEDQCCDGRCGDAKCVFDCTCGDGYDCWNNLCNFVPNW